MDTDQTIKTAQEIFGDGRDSDYKLLPSAHATELGTRFPALEKLLARSELRTLSRQYEEKDRDAFRAQEIFKAASTQANWAIFLTACFSALLLVAGPLRVLLPNTLPQKETVSLILGLAAIASGALASMWTYQLREGNLLDDWMNARAAAEALRIQYFETATSIKDDLGNSDIPLPLLQLEYFRRYQLDVQRAYFHTRGAQHKQTAHQILAFSGMAVALGSIATGIGGLLGAAVHPQWMAFAGVGVIATAMATFAGAWESSGQYRRNAQRYQKVLDTLDSFTIRLDAVRRAAAQGDRESLEKFVAGVHEQLSAEIRQWLEVSATTKDVIARLDDALHKAGTKPPKTDTPSAIAPQQVK